MEATERKRDVNTSACDKSFELLIPFLQTPKWKQANQGSIVDWEVNQEN